MSDEGTVYIYFLNSLFIYSLTYIGRRMRVYTVSTSWQLRWLLNQKRNIWFQEDSYSDEDSGTEEVSDAED